MISSRMQYSLYTFLRMACQASSYVTKCPLTVDEMIGALYGEEVLAAARELTRVSSAWGQDATRLLLHSTPKSYGRVYLSLVRTGGCKLPNMLGSIADPEWHTRLHALAPKWLEHSLRTAYLCGEADTFVEKIAQFATTPGRMVAVMPVLQKSKLDNNPFAGVAPTRYPADVPDELRKLAQEYGAAIKVYVMCADHLPKQPDVSFI